MLKTNFFSEISRKNNAAISDNSCLTGSSKLLQTQSWVEGEEIMGITIICRNCSHEVEEGNPKCSDCACGEHDYDTFVEEEWDGP